MRRTVSLLLAAALALGPAGCTGDRSAAAGPLVVFNAGSLARPLRAALDSFSAREGVRYEQESAGSLESARKLTELGKIPDLIALADAEVFPGYLVPAHVTRYVEFARNRMVLAFTPRSAHADSVSTLNWWRIMQRPDVEVGRADPELDPNGYRTLLAWQLAELHYAQPGLAARLAARSPPRNMRPKEADLMGLLEAGEFDYIWSYESIARGAGLRYLRLPAEIDLSERAHEASYARAAVRVRGASAGDTVTFRGEPIVYGLAVPDRALHRALGERFATFLLSAEGRAILRHEGLDALEVPMLRMADGSGAPLTGAPGTPDTPDAR